MSGFKTPKFSRTGGSTQDNNSSKGSSFFSSLFKGSLDQSLKSKKSSTFSGGNTWQGEGTLPDDKSYYSKTTSSTATRHISAFAWVSKGSSILPLPNILIYTCAEEPKPSEQGQLRGLNVEEPAGCD